MHVMYEAMYVWTYVRMYSMHFQFSVSTGTKIISVSAYYIQVSVVELELKLEK